MARGRHAAPSWWSRRVTGTWTQNKLLSRKWWLVVGCLGAIIILDVLGRALQSTTLHVLEIVIPAYLAVEGALDWRWKRKAQKVEPDTQSSLLEEVYKRYTGGDV